MIAINGAPGNYTQSLMVTGHEWSQRGENAIYCEWRVAIKRADLSCTLESSDEGKKTPRGTEGNLHND